MDVNQSISDRCQSCGMPLKTGEPSDKSFYGIEADGTFSLLYCKFCYKNGVFAEPELLLEGMIERSVSHMTRVLKIPEEQAKEAARSTIPRLKRWQRG